jgi:coenzyme F420-0:L-glutamate ligase/coenzyme F420-1:gamma-L-glutamate ligase
VKLTIFGIGGLPEFVAGDDLAQIIGDAVSLGTVSTGSIRVPTLSTGTIPIQRAPGSTPATEPEGSILQDGDILAVTSKIVSKAEGRQIVAADREDAITAETVRVVATRGHTRIVENRLGLVLAAAGVDASNTPDGTVLLLPVDPDATAHHLASTLRARLGVRIGIIITDTIGRPWRNGQVDIAIGAAGIRVLDDLRGTVDTNGRPMDVTVQATADELASAADLIKGKTTGMPVAIVRGLAHLVGDLAEPGARSVVRPSDEDMFRLGSREAYELGYRAGLAAQAGQHG